VKVGDLVTYKGCRPRTFVGLVTEVGDWTANCDVKVLWAHESEPVTQTSFHLKVIHESR
jgi:hypothetical protein